MYQNSIVPPVIPTIYTQEKPKNNTWKWFLLFIILLLSFVTMLFFLNKFLIDKYLKVSCIWSPTSLIDNQQNKQYIIPATTTLPAGKSSTIGILIESKYPLYSKGEIAIFYSPIRLDKNSKRIWTGLFPGKGRASLQDWRITPLNTKYRYSFDYLNDQKFAKEGYYYFALIAGNKIIKNHTCAVSQRIIETNGLIPRFDIFKYVK